MECGNLYELMKTNTEKMNFQQNMCFQMKNWTIAITVAIIGVAWKLDWKGDDIVLIIVSISFHLPLLFFLFFFKKTTKNWMYYFIVFRERTKLLEKLIIQKSSDENASFNMSEYYKYHLEQSPDKDIDYEKIEEEFDKQARDRFFLYLISITFISLITMMIYAKFGGLVS